MKAFLVIILFLLYPTTSFGMYATHGMAGVCLNPIEQAILYSNQRNAQGSSSLKAQIKQAQRGIKLAQQGLDRVIDDIDEEIGDLSNSLVGEKTLMSPSNVSEKIGEYIEGKHDSWKVIDQDNCKSAQASSTSTSSSPSSSSPSSTSSYPFSQKRVQKEVAVEKKHPVAPSSFLAPAKNKTPNNKANNQEEMIFVEPGANLIKKPLDISVQFFIPLAYAQDIDDLDFCAAWQSEKIAKNYFKRNGKVDRKFCKEYSRNARDCERSIKRLTDKYDRKNKLEEQIDALEEQLAALEDAEFDKKYGFGEDDEEETEAEGLCFECLEKYRKITGPTATQKIGNFLSIAGGAALSYYGYRATKRAQRSANDLRSWQGFEAQSNPLHTIAGLGLGFPFITQGIYGLSAGNRAQGGFACGGGYNAYGATGGAFNPYGGVALPYGGAQARLGVPGFGGFNSYGAGNPFGAGLYGPGGGFQAQIGVPGFGGFNPYGAGNPFGAGLYGPGAGFQAQIGLPGAGGFNPYGAGNPFGAGLYGPGAGFQAQIGLPGFGGFNPYGAGLYGPGAGAGFNAGFGGFNPYGAGGFNPYGAGAGAGFGINPYGAGGFNPYGAGAGAGFGVNPYLQAQAQAQQQALQQAQAQQQYQEQLRRQQYEAYLAAEQQRIARQRAIHEEWQKKQTVISGLMQEIQQIQGQIQLISTTGVSGNFGGDASASYNFNSGVALGTQQQQGYSHNEAVDTGASSGFGTDTPIIEGR